MMGNAFSKIITCTCLSLGWVFVFASQPPQKRPVHIELIYDDSQATTTVMGNGRSMSILPFTYFHLSDVYSNKEIKIGSDLYRDNISSLDFELSHPLYDEIQRGSNVRIPFYVEPGDTLLIYLNRSGRALRYSSRDGGPAKCTKLLLHDISNRVFYNEKSFVKDREGVLFPEFVERVVIRMHSVLDSVSNIANIYDFSEKERRIAMNNVKLQFALWIFEYAPYKYAELSAYSSRHKEGWQSLQKQDDELASIEDVANYAFLRELPLNDSTCMASKFFPHFLTSYENTHVLNCDQYLFYGTNASDVARMDSALVAKEKRMTGLTTSSLFLDIAMERKHIDLPLNDGSIQLKEVKVIGSKPTGYYKGISDAEMLNARLNNRPTYNALSPSYWLFDRKHEKRLKRAKDLIKKFEEEEEREKAEHDAIMKAYEEEMKRKEE